MLRATTLPIVTANLNFKVSNNWQYSNRLQYSFYSIYKIIFLSLKCYHCLSNATLSAITFIIRLSFVMTPTKHNYVKKILVLICLWMHLSHSSLLFLLIKVNTKMLFLYSNRHNRVQLTCADLLHKNNLIELIPSFTTLSDTNVKKDQTLNLNWITLNRFFENFPYGILHPKI